MRDRALHDTLKAFVVDAAAALAAEIAAGAEIQFELSESKRRRGHTPLYRYRPLTASFISERLGLLSGLATYSAAARAIAEQRCETYLCQQGVTRVPTETRQLADAVLLALLQRIFDERSEFELDPARFELAYQELELSLFAGQRVETVIAPILGVAFDPTTPELVLEEGLSLVRGDKLRDAPPEAVWDDAEEPHVLLVLSLGERARVQSSVSIARQRFRRVLTALRLFERGGYALGPLAWTRIDAGSWRAVALGASGRHRMTTLLPARREDELRAFYELVARHLPGSGEVAWALARFEMGCERVGPFEALSDYLLALRALLEPEGPQSGRLAQRLAMLCAAPHERAALAERTARTVALERSVIAGLRVPGHEAGAASLIAELAEHLRAILRDVLCGYLDSDLVRVADGLLAEAATALEHGEAPAAETAQSEPWPDPAAEPWPDPQHVVVEDRRYPSPWAAPHSAPRAGRECPAGQAREISPGALE